MKKISVSMVCLFIAAAVHAQSISSPPDGNNQLAKVSQFIGPVEVTITYHSPNVHGTNGKDRTGHIWGELVHYGFIDQGFGPSKAAPWRAGANENTTISFSHDVMVEGKKLSAGTYGLFLETQKDGPWTWIFSKNNSSWGSYFYNESEDALRVNETPQESPYTEYLSYTFEDRKPESATAVLAWENKKIPMKISVPDTHEIYLSMIRNELRSSPGFDTRNWSAAARYCAQNKINLEEGLTWADKAMDPSIGGATDFDGLRAKADVLDAMGKNADADAIMDKAIHLPTATVFQIHSYGRSLLNAGKKESALKVFQYNAKAHPEEKFTTFVGLARGYTAIGDKKNAISNWETALKNVPENQKQNLPRYQDELKKLKESK
jgi:tetratricopeptide (TPR) repeat protein